MASQTLRKSTLPPADTALAERLRIERAAERFTQEEFAAEVGLTRASLSNYEYGLARLPFSAGWNICKRLDLNPRWLATGVSPQRPFVRLAELGMDEASLRPALAPRTSFIDGYEKFLRGKIEAWLKENPPDKIIARMMQGGPSYTARRLSLEQLEMNLMDFAVSFRNAADTFKKAGYLSIIEALTAEIRSRFESRYPQLSQLKEPTS